LIDRPVPKGKVTPSGTLKTIMMTNGLYKTALTTRLKTLEEAEGVSYGVMVLHNGRMFGGGPFFYTVGSYTCFGSGRWKGEMIGQEHTPALATRLWARKVVSLAFTGTYGELTLETQGFVLVGKRSIPFKMDYRLLQAD
jgi:hypothetical protein